VTFGEKIIHARARLVCEQGAGERLGARNDFIDGADADIAPVELKDDVSALFEAYRTAHFGREADAAGFRYTPFHGVHGFGSFYATS
jgi:hypothetical protein